MLVRSTKVLIIGVEAHVVSCAATVDTTSAERIVEAMARGLVKLVGYGIVEGEKVRKYVDVKGKAAHFPNRAEKLKLLDVSKRQAFAKLRDVMPEALKGELLEGLSYHPVKRMVNCANCGSVIEGTRREKVGSIPQGFKPNNKNVTNNGHDWLCGCTTKPPIPKHPVKEKRSKKELFPFMESGAVGALDGIITLSGTIDQIRALVRSLGLS